MEFIFQWEGDRQHIIHIIDDTRAIEKRKLELGKGCEIPALKSPLGQGRKRMIESSYYLLVLFYLSMLSIGYP